MKITFEQEIYEHFEYKNPRAWFHTFESDNVVHGFSFANEREAKAFFDSVNTVVYSISGNAKQTKKKSANRSYIIFAGPPIVTSAPTPAPVNNAQQLTKQKSFNAPAPATTAEKKPKEKKKLFGKKKKEDAVFEISGPTGFKHESHIGWDAKKGFEVKCLILLKIIHIYIYIYNTPADSQHTSRVEKIISTSGYPQERDERCRNGEYDD